MKIETLVENEKISVVLGNALRNGGIDTTEKLGNTKMKDVMHVLREFYATHNYGRRLVDEMPVLMKRIK